MFELSCPLCESPVRAPNTRPHTRLHCRKCHTPLHLNKAGRAVIGEPPDVEQDLEALRQKIRGIRGRIPIRRVVAAVVAVLVVGVPVRHLLGPSQGLARAAEWAARALVENDEGSIRSIAAPGTSDDAARWFAEAHRELVRQRERWYGKEEVIDVNVVGEDRSQGRGVVGVSIRPGFGSARDVSLADPASATASAASPCNLEMIWTRSWWRGWMLDGRETEARRRETHHPAP